VERIYREVKAYAIPGGSEEIMLNLAAGQFGFVVGSYVTAVCAGVTHTTHTHTHTHTHSWHAHNSSHTHHTHITQHTALKKPPPLLNKWLT